MVLSMVDQGKEVTLAHIDGGRGMRSRLFSMGFVPGTAFTVLSRNGGGPVLGQGERLQAGHWSENGSEDHRGMIFFAHEIRQV